MLDTMHTLPETSSSYETGLGNAPAVVVNRAVNQLERHPRFRGRSRTIQLEFREGTIILSGRVPSFYLKQLLQEAMRNIEGVEKIDNRVDVTCSYGLSSTRGHDCNPG